MGAHALQAVVIPGVIDSLGTLVEDHRKQFLTYKKNILSEPQGIGDYSQIEHIYIDGLFLRSVMLHSPEGLLGSAKDNPCFFYSLLESGLIKDSEGSVKGVIVNVKFKNQEKLQTHYISKESLLNYVHQDTCFANKDISRLFSPNNITKTLDTLKYPIPSNTQECDNILREWTDNKYMPYLCGVSKIIEEGEDAEVLIASVTNLEPTPLRLLEERASKKKAYSERIDYSKTNYLKNLCKGISNPAAFCGQYVSTNTWTKIIGGEDEQYKLDFKCRALLGKESVTIKDIALCAKKFQQEPEVCATLSTQGFPSLFPKPDCRHIGKALAKSNLKTRYMDCPGAIDNAAVANAHRIVQHFESEPLPMDPKRCLFQTGFSFANLNFRFKYSDGWPMKICYTNRVSQEDDCLTYIPGYDEQNEFAENMVVAKALEYLIAMPPTSKCRPISQQTYNPVLIDYKSGCFIVYDANRCTSSDCPRRVVYDGESIEGISFQGKPIFSYFPNSLGNPSFALSSIVDNIYKQQPRSVRNLTEVKFFLDSGNAIIHGIGCLEDLIPQFFRKQSFNQCRPIPFIVDGYDQDEEFLVSVRTAIDDVHSPRLIKWADLYNSVITYQNIHPLKTWTMNVLR